MKHYRVVLAKSYMIRVKADSPRKAREIAEFYTGDIKDISTSEDRRRFNFSIEEIECGMNESLEVEETKKK